MAALQQIFRPEFINRVDDIVIFKPLGQEQIERIIELQLQSLVGILAGRQITLTLTAAAKKLLFREGYDPAYGARPMKRAIQRLIQDPLAMQILDGAVHAGDEVVVDADAEAMKFGHSPVKVGSA
jgi:ATP-dependent Clp protease ATP-binding subunit ClpB